MFEDVINYGAGKFISNGEWIHPNRTIDTYEIIFVTKGEVFINENGINYHLKANELLLLEPNVHHFGFKESNNTEFYWFHWRGASKYLNSIKYRKIENPYTLLIFMQQLTEALFVKKPTEYLDYLTRLILIELYCTSLSIKTNHITERVSMWIIANRHTALTAKIVSKQFGYNSDYLNRLFRSVYSKTLKQYIDEKRMEYIKELMLQSNISLKDVGLRSGFTEYKYFLKFFKYHERISPTEFLKLHAKMHINSK